MVMHMDYKCYSYEHFKWIMIAGLPILVIWVIAAPIVLMTILLKNRRNLYNESIRKYFFIIYQGLKPSRFYWEAVNTFRKFIVLGLSVFLATYDPNYQVLFSIFFLYVMSRLQRQIQPYKKEENNKIDNLAINAVIITLY